ncbi:hypothetical protein F4804DRAFT_312446 [Jackrogersella minutella]|nr:hypothetical protein F4804DRAFT_312446 [Jackrogersella minutella]
MSLKDSQDSARTMTHNSQLGEDLVKLIHGSNYIEVTGSDFDVTEKLCRRIFGGEEVRAQVEAGSSEYKQASAALVTLKRPSYFQDIVRSRQEIINHAQALNYAVDHVVLNSESITEYFLKEVHGKLCSGNGLGEDTGSPGL